MKNEKLEIIHDLVLSNVSPIVVKDTTELLAFTQMHKCATTVINAKHSDVELELLGNKEPSWLTDANEDKGEKFNLLIIDNFFEIKHDEQMRFFELLKHRKVYTWKLNDTIVIILKGKKSEKSKVNQTLLSLLTFA